MRERDMSNVGRVIKDFYCNGFAGRRFDLEGAIIISEGDDFIIAFTADRQPVSMKSPCRNRGLNQN